MYNGFAEFDAKEYVNPSLKMQEGFAKGDVVCIVDYELCPFRASEVFDSFLPEERRVSTLLGNVNRKGEIMSIRRFSEKRNGGRMKIETVVIRIAFGGGVFVELRNPSLIRKLN